MTDQKQEGPSRPPLVCWGCIHHERVNDGHPNDPAKWSECRHPDADPPPNRLANYNGRAPDWCPVLKERESETS